MPETKLAYGQTPEEPHVRIEADCAIRAKINVALASSLSDGATVPAHAPVALGGGIIESSPLYHLGQPKTSPEA